MKFVDALIATSVIPFAVTALRPRAAPGRGSYPTYEAAHRRNVFFAGGEYAFNAAANGTVFQNQVYVEQLTPATGPIKPYPLVFLPGGGSTGTTWLNTPDNRTGWASYFLDRGYAVHLIDYPSTGRSQKLPETAARAVSAVESAQQYFTAPEKFPAYPQATLHTQWPGTGLRGDPVFDLWFASQQPVPTGVAEVERAMRKAMCDLLRRIGPSIIVGHSYGGGFLITIADECPELIKGLFGVEPAATPFTPGRRPYGVAATPLRYDPPVNSPSDLIQQPVGTNTAANNSCILQAEPAKKLVNVSKVPMAFYTAQASIHIVYDHCLAAYLWQAGVTLDWILLEERGILGNGHFSFLEKNSLVIAQNVVEPYFKRWSARN